MKSSRFLLPWKKSCWWLLQRRSDRCSARYDEERKNERILSFGNNKNEKWVSWCLRQARPGQAEEKWTEKNRAQHRQASTPCHVKCATNKSGMALERSIRRTESTKVNIRRCTANALCVHFSSVGRTTAGKLRGHWTRCPTHTTEPNWTALLFFFFARKICVLTDWLDCSVHCWLLPCLISKSTWSIEMQLQLLVECDFKLNRHNSLSITSGPTL